MEDLKRIILVLEDSPSEFGRFAISEVAMKRGGGVIAFLVFDTKSEEQKYS